MSLFEALRRHPLPALTHFDHSLLVTYALPPEQVAPLLPAGLELDIYQSPDGVRHAFVAMVAVSLRRLRIPYMPSLLGLATVMTGYRVFARYPTPGGRILRGQRILRNDADSALITRTGNLLTDYHHERIQGWMEHRDGQLRFIAHSVDGTADVDVLADVSEDADPYSEGKPPWDDIFATAEDARRYAGPRGFSFAPGGDGGIVVVKTFRSDWQPRPVCVEVRRASFFQHGPFAGTKPKLVHAFYTADIRYGWHRGLLRPARPA